jgi:hypothetical protein
MFPPPQQAEHAIRRTAQSMVDIIALIFIKRLLTVTGRMPGFIISSQRIEWYRVLGLIWAMA